MNLLLNKLNTITTAEKNAPVSSAAIDLLHCRCAIDRPRGSLTFIDIHIAKFSSCSRNVFVTVPNLSFQCALPCLRGCNSRNGGNLLHQ